MSKLRIEHVRESSRLPSAVLKGAVDSHGTRHRLGLLEQDPRLDTTFLVATCGDARVPVAVLPVSRPLTPQWHDRHYDPGRLRSTLAGRDAREFLLVAGVSGRQTTVFAPAHPELQDAAASRLWSETEKIGRSEGRSPLAQFVSKDSRLHRAAMASGNACELPDADRFVIPDAGSDLAGYLTTLDRRRRGLVRRDLRDIAATEVRTSFAPWDDLPAWSFDAIAEVKGHYAPTSSALIRYRLRQLAGDPDVSCVAFIAETHGGARGVAVGWLHGRCLELYEIGLLAPEGCRLQLYLELMFYAPLRMLWSSGGGSLDLAMAAPRPKLLRGARTVMQVSLIGADALHPDDTTGLCVEGN